MAHIAAIGEVMVELAPFPIDTPETLNNISAAKGRDIMALSFAGDTYNTAVYMARLGLQTDYVTNLGEDTYSQQIMQRMTNENIGTGMNGFNHSAVARQITLRTQYIHTLCACNTRHKFQ